MFRPALDRARHASNLRLYIHAVFTYGALRGLFPAGIWWEVHEVWVLKS